MTNRKNGGRQNEPIAGTGFWVIQSRWLLNKGMLKTIPVGYSLWLLDRCIEEGIKPSRIVFGDENDN